MAHVSASPGQARGDAAPTLLAIAFVLLAVALFSVMDALSKILAATYDPVEVVWGRYLAILAMLAPPVLRNPASLVTARPVLQLVRGVTVLGAALFFIAGLARLPIADATAIAFASPLVVTALSIPLLREQVGPRRWAAVAAGFVGVLIVVRPGSGATGWAALLPLLSAACWGLSLVVTRRMRGGDRPVTTLLYSTVIGFVASTVALPLVWQPPSAAAWGMMVLMGALSAGGQYLLIAGLARGDASLLAPFSYSQMIWSTLTGFFVFGTVPTAWTWCGAAIIVASGIYIAHRERLRARAAARLSI
ncbi:MAG TPA: DMT family transporter [Stellaceae bacterium]|nr:DMT family transporter [Stellaceae bacterium]